MGNLLSHGASAPSASWAASPSDAHCVRDTHLGATSFAWECSPGPTRECVAMTIVVYCSPAPSCHCKSLVKNQNSQGFANSLDFSTGRGCGRFFSSLCFRKMGQKRGQRPQNKTENLSIGIHKEIYFLIARIINHNCCHVSQEENDCGHMKKK